MTALYEDGVLIEPSVKRLDVTAFLSLPTAKLAPGQGLADALQLAAAVTLRQAGLPQLDFLTADVRLAEAAEIEGLVVLR